MQDRNYSAGIGDLKGMQWKRSDKQSEYASGRGALRWTRRKSVACTLAAILFAGAFLYVALTLIIATGPHHQ